MRSEITNNKVVVSGDNYTAEIVAVGGEIHAKIVGASQDAFQNKVRVSDDTSLDFLPIPTEANWHAFRYDYFGSEAFFEVSEGEEGLSLNVYDNKDNAIMEIWATWDELSPEADEPSRKPF